MRSLQQCANSEFYVIVFRVGIDSSHLLSTFILPARSDHWNELVPLPPIISPTPSGISPYVTSVYKITVPWKAKSRGNPVDNTNRDEWTEFQRKRAEQRYIPKNLTDLQEKVR